MGYTHYFYVPKTFPKAGFELFSAEVNRMFELAEKKGIPLAGGHGDGKPVANSREVWFNGVGDEAHETLFVSQTFKPEPWERVKPNGLYFSFCKTARNPYDDVVVAVLLSLRHHFPAVQLGSDGDAADLANGAAFYEEATGRKADLSVFKG